MAGSSLGVATSKGAGGVIRLYADNGTSQFSVAVGAIQSWTLKHNDDRTETRGTNGCFVGVSTSNNDTLTLQVNAILSATTTASDVLLSGKLPKGNGRASITGAEVLAVGPWTDAINVTAGSAPDTYFWVYQADGEISASNSGDDKTVTFTLKRYSTFSVTSAAAIAI